MSAAGGFLSNFISRLAPTMAFSALPVAMTLMENPQTLETEEGRKQLLAMGGASLLSGVIGAGAGAGLNSIGSRFFPGPKVRAVRPQINEGLDVLNKGNKVLLNEKTPLAQIDERFNAVTKGMKSDQLERATNSVAGLKKYLNDPIHEIAQASGTGQTLGTIGDVMGGMATWSPIYNAIAGPQPLALDPSQYHEITGVMGAGSQDMYINQQIGNRLLQGDGLPVEAYAPGTMFNRSGLPSYENDPYDMTHLMA